MKIKGVNKYLKRENKIANQPINRYIKEKTYLDIEKEIKNHTLRVALPPPPKCIIKYSQCLTTFMLRIL